MSIADTRMLFQFVGGLGMFLYGMHVMADGLQKSAGGKMKQLLGVLTNHRILGVLVGTLVTAIIQSSSATTVMVVGFVNAGIINLTQAVGVIMGANIGTTVTSWIVSMSEWGDMMKPEFFAPLLIGFGAFAVLFAKKEKNREIGEILVGFGILFIGLSFMSSSITPYRDAPIFTTAFRVLGSNPILGILTGAAVTAIIQSSSASVGILQTLALNGVVTWNSAIYITLGQNIGTCVTALLSSAGANRTAKRAAVIHLLFNVIGSIIFAVLMFVVFTMNPAFAGGHVTSVGISIFHTIFNISNTLLLFPFAKQLVDLSGKIVREKPEKMVMAEIPDVLERPQLDGRILSSPSFAIQSVAEQVTRMGEISLEHVNVAMDSVFNVSEEKINESIQMEKTLDVFEKDLTDYLVRLSHESLTEAQIQTVSHLLFTVSDLERIGDHCDNIAELAQGLVQANIRLSQDALEDLRDIQGVVLKAVDLAVDSRRKESIMDAKRVYMLEDDVDSMEEDMRQNHMERLSKGLCSTDTGIVFLDILSNLERISDHAVNIAEYVEAEK
ncbi:MAG: Na/Pi cotransporter family protein [Clostridia bacterium]|nr:Na/Pi cotransporter family protein [Lachnospiraceae bacterium]NCB99668.1 Na/Pi cotransporter family protein [Clostridia bacterium]NCD01759.1 Na/Pi cotransporter family protein [Clostridia bacterium]